MRSLLFFLITISSSPCASQIIENDPFVGFADVYVIAVKVLSLEYKGKCICGMEGITESTSCNLYKVRVDSIHLFRDSSVYSKSELLNLDYIVLSSNEKIEFGNEYLIFCSNSTSSKYLVGNKVAPTNEKYVYASTLPYITGLTECYRFSIWQKIKILFGADRQTFNQSAKESFDRKNKFLQSIQSRG